MTDHAQQLVDASVFSGGINSELYAAIKGRLLPFGDIAAGCMRQRLQAYGSSVSKKVPWQSKTQPMGGGEKS